MKKVILLVGLAASILSGCKDPDEPVNPEPQEVQTLTVTINHVFDNELLTFNSEAFTLASGENVVFKRLAYLLSEFYLVKTDNTRVTLADQYALLNPASDPNEFNLADIPMGEYKAFGFSIGLDSVTNHGNPNQYSVDHPLSPFKNSLYWSWQGGYVFTAIEGSIGGTQDNFVFHLAGSNNKIDFEFPLNFTKDKAALEASLTYNLAEAFKNPDVFSLANDGASTHSTDDPVTTKLINNMRDVFELEAINSVE